MSSSTPSSQGGPAQPVDIPWKPLDPAKRQIRVIQLLETPDPTLHCQLHTVSLDDWTPEYIDHSRHLPSRSVAERTEAWTRSAFYDPNCDGGSDTISFPRWRFDITDLGPSQLPVGNFKLLSELATARCSQINNNSPVASKAGSFAQNTFNIRPRFRWGDFEAISYCWGSPTKDSMIYVNGILVPIPKSLDGALRQAQKLPDAGSVYFWADALSIAQGDLDEKNHQVRMMRDIFSNALSVVSCLGHGMDVQNGTVDAIVEFDYMLTQTSKFWEHGESSELFDTHWADLNWLGTIAILSSQYWSRLWIIQELALNHNMTLFLCGDAQMTRNMIQRVAKMGRDSSRQVALTFETQSSSFGQPATISAQKVFDMAEQVDSVLRLTSKPVDDVSRQKTDATPPKSTPFHPRGLTQILDLAQKASCDNLQDKVFGLAGIFSEYLGPVIEPDYTAPVESTYIDFGKTLLRTRGAEETLSWSSQSSTLNLPTWVPNLAVRFPRNHVRGLRSSRACATRTGVPASAGTTLRCRGLIVDGLSSVCTSVSESFPFEEDAAWDVDAQIPPPLKSRYGDKAGTSLALSQTLTMNHSLARLLPTRWRALRHENEDTILGNVFWVQDEDWAAWDSPDSAPCSWDQYWGQNFNFPFPTHEWHAFQRWRQTNANFHLFGHRLRDFFQYIHPDDLPPPDRLVAAEDLCMVTWQDMQNMRLAVLALKGRKLATTGTGWMALVPEDAASGDVVAVLYSVNFPVVLRPCGEVFRYIGECYVHGMMNGEAIDMLDRGELVERDIVLC